MNTYTSFSQRFFAGLVDGLLFLPIVVIVMIVWDLSEPGALLIYSIAIAAIHYAYSIGMHYRYGQTVGKMAMSIKVIHANEVEQKLTLQQAFIRDAVPLFFDMVIYTSAVISLNSTGSFSEDYFDWPLSLWFLLEVITMLTNHKRRAIHDFIANTVVIEYDPKKQVAGEEQFGVEG